MNTKALLDIFCKKAQENADSGIVSSALRVVTEKFIDEWQLTQKAIDIVNEGTANGGDFLEKQKPILKVNGTGGKLTTNSGLVPATLGSLLKDSKAGTKLVQLISAFNQELRPVLEKELARLNIKDKINNIETYIDNRQYFSI
jgi:hypothetical protein